MIFKELSLVGAYVVELQKHTDERGFFARSWCRREFEEHGLDARLVQCNISYNARRGTLRGTRGALYDVIIDLRPNSPTFLRWAAAELTADNRAALYVPQGFAHGFQT